MSPVPPDIARVREQADTIHDAAAVRVALDAMAAAVTERLAEANPVILAVVMGGLLPAAWLTERLRFPFEMDYIHATRYRGATRGAALHWQARPRTALDGRSVLLVDDILDEGVTLAGVVAECRRLGAAEVLTAVLTEKQHDRNRTGLKADFVGLEVPDRYVFGCGLDYKHYWRQLPAIYALPDSK